MTCSHTVLDSGTVRLELRRRRRSCTRVHQVRNPGDVPAVATWQTRPALRSADFHCAIAAARESGDVSRLLAVVEEFSDVFVLAPQPVDP